MKQIREYSTSLPISFHQELSSTDDRLILLLHGYTDSGSSFLRRAFRGIQPKASILAPNGPFPIPVKSGDTYKEAYAWYFWEMAKDNMVIHPNVAVGLIKNVIQDLGYAEKPKILVGFSQGAFFAPYLFSALQNIRAFAAIGAAYREQDYVEKQDFPIRAFHGDQDEIISLSRSQKSFEHLLATGKIHGDYRVIPGLAHTVNEELSTQLIESIESWW